MGMAHRAPNPHYVRTLNISHHALERFRERVDEDLKSRSNNDLSNLLDEKVCQAKKTYTVRDPRAPEAITKLHEIEMRNSIHYAVVRDETVITVLDEDMVKGNYDLSYQPTLNAPFADKLRELQLQPRKLTPQAQAIMVGGPLPRPVPPAPSVPTPLEAAGMAYAYALKRKRECELALVSAQQQVVEAQKAVEEATRELTEATEKLTALTAGVTP